VWANRSGSKSYLAGLIAWVLSSFNHRLETTILGGSLDQSEKVYKAMEDIWTLTTLQDEYLKMEPTRRLSSWRNGSTVAVLTASTRSTRGPHPQHLIMDEIDEMPAEVYRAALSQPQSKHGIFARLGQYSTNHRSGGMMDEALEQARIHQTSIYRWCIWECLEPCLDYSCSTCKLSSWCPGKHMKQADGFYRVQDFIDKLEYLSESALQVEWLCRKIGPGNLVYGDQYDPKIHSRGDLPGFDPGRYALVSIDWGGTHPFSLGCWQLFNIGWVRVDEIQQAGDNPHLIKTAQGKAWWPNIRGGVGDPSRPDLMSEWRAFIPMTEADNDVDIGLEAVRKALRPVIGPPTMWINQVNRHWISEEAGYIQRHGKPVKERDHAMDETRYFAMWQMKPAPRKGKVFVTTKAMAATSRGDARIDPAVMAAIAGLAGQPVATAARIIAATGGLPIIGGGQASVQFDKKTVSPISSNPASDLSPTSQLAAPPISPPAIEAPSAEKHTIQRAAAEARRAPGADGNDEGPGKPPDPQVNEIWPPKPGQGPQPPPEGVTDGEPLRPPPPGTGASQGEAQAPRVPGPPDGQKPVVGPVDANSGTGSVAGPNGGQYGKRKGRVFIPK